MIAIKEELHELIEETSDEELLRAVKVILSSQNIKQASLADKGQKAALQKIVMSNGRVVFITPGNPSEDASELFGIWKDSPEIVESLRKIAWGGRA